ncbi:MAG: hypothetical protein NTX86_02325 [Candidatus Dependentiae bacterium]|nr:hypothetical protein [Candidatus Dependentiae bacterium]
MVRKVKKTNDIVTASWNKEPQSEAEYICMGNELLAWVQEESSLAIDGFPISKMIAPSIFHALPNKSTQFAQAYDIALGIIGTRRERLAHEGMLNAHIVRETMPLYDPVYRKWRISEKNKEENMGETKFITIEIPHWLNCPDGSHKKETDDFLAREKLKAQSQRQ